MRKFYLELGRCFSRQGNVPGHCLLSILCKCIYTMYTCVCVCVYMCVCVWVYQVGAGEDGGIASVIDNTFPNRFRVGAYLDDRGGAGGGRGGGDWRGGRGGGGAGSAGARVYRGAVDEIRWWAGVRTEATVSQKFSISRFYTGSILGH